MPDFSINNPSVIRHNYQPLELCAPPLIKSSAALTPGDGVRGFSHAKSELPQILEQIFEWVSPLIASLQRMLGRQRRSIAPHVQFVPNPEVPPTPTRVTPDSQVDSLADLSSKRDGAKADDIFGGFRQGPGGNCVTVSAIKAAMAKFGQSPTDIFKEVRKEQDGYQVIMRDGFALRLSQQELAEGTRASRFVGRDKEVLKDAHFLFAVSAKRAQLENNDGYAARSFKHALRSLNDGEDEYGPGEGLLRLGLSRHIESVPVSELAAGELGMVNRKGHSVAVINGVEEFYGRKGRAPRRGEAVALR